MDCHPLLPTFILNLLAMSQRDSDKCDYACVAKGRKSSTKPEKDFGKFLLYVLDEVFYLQCRPVIDCIL